MTTPLLDRLAALSSQRTTRTDRLCDVVHALLAKLELACEVGDSATVDGHVLTSIEVHSNVGHARYWQFHTTEEVCHLDAGVGIDKYMHGDFHCRIVGPTREALLAFASRAERFAQAFHDQRETEVRKLDQAIATVESVPA